MRSFKACCYFEGRPLIELAFLTERRKCTIYHSTRRFGPVWNCFEFCLSCGYVRGPSSSDRTHGDAAQVITTPEERYAEYRCSSDFIKEYIFPGACCPSLTALTQAMATHSNLW